MQLVLNGLILPADVIVSDPFSDTKIYAVTEAALDKTELRWEEASNEPTRIYIAGTDKRAPFYKWQMDILYAMARIPNTAYLLLNYKTEPISVMFAHDDPPVVSGTPIVEIPNPPQDHTYHNVLIKLKKY